MRNVLFFSLIALIFASCGSVPEAKIKFLDDNTVTILRTSDLNLYDQGDTLFLENVAASEYKLDENPRMSYYEEGVRCYDGMYLKDSTYITGYCVINRMAVILKKI